MSSAVNRPWGHGWRVETRASRARHGDVGGDPQYVWRLYDSDRHRGSVNCDEDHGWDAYSHVDHGYLPGKLTGPDGADDERQEPVLQEPLRRDLHELREVAICRSISLPIGARATATPIGRAEAAALSSPEALDGVGADSN